MRRLSWFERVIITLLLFFDMSYAVAQTGLKLPGDSAQLIPVLDQEIDTYWYELGSRTWLYAIPDQEANWKLKATLKTSRELGCGLGQFTIAYNANGTVRFDALAETRRLDPSLRDWNWQDCYNAQFQLRGLTLKMKVNNRSCSIVMADLRNTLACNGAAYNGGYGSVTKRIRLCSMDPKCDPMVWFGNLETKCAQSNVKAEGYGESFCQINAKYPSRVEARQIKFLPLRPGEVALSKMAKKEVK